MFSEKLYLTEKFKKLCGLLLFKNIEKYLEIAKR